MVPYWPNHAPQVLFWNALGAILLKKSSLTREKVKYPQIASSARGLIEYSLTSDFLSSPDLFTAPST